MAKRRDQSIHTVRQLIDTIAIPRLTLTIERERGAVVARSVVFDGDLCRIGTHSSNDLVLTDPAVSRFHCRLVREDGGWRVRDTGSLNGTRLDNVRIRDADLTADGGVIALGDSIVRVRQAAAEREALVPMIPSFGAITGTSVAMRKLFAMLEKVAQSDINVLIEGESGTGKELVATEIVQRGTRGDKPFVIVDCGAISPNLVESELFGHVRGAFTGADRDRVGAFEAADTGTVFLDEIGELPLELQPKLLRALEAREIRRVGETRARKVNVRVVSATNRDLERDSARISISASPSSRFTSPRCASAWTIWRSSCATSSASSGAPTRSASSSPPSWPRWPSTIGPATCASSGTTSSARSSSRPRAPRAASRRRRAPASARRTWTSASRSRSRKTRPSTRSSARTWARCSSRAAGT